MIALAALLLASPYTEVVAAERAFAAASIKDGFHAAFAAAFAPDGVVFDPTPTNAIAKHGGKPRADVVLSWAPAWAAVSPAGDLGFTSGPWEYRPAGDKPPATGWFFTAWRKEADGTWKVEADLGIHAELTYAAPGEVVDALAAAAPAKATPSSAAQARLAVLHAEQLLARAGASGLGQAIAAVAHSAIRVYRDGGPPGSAALLVADTREPRCEAARVTASASGDLAYAYGTCDDSKKDKKYGYVRVWRRNADGTWRVFVDVTP
ncbi:MAG TPA: DUF4440 domain-containing protein [Candidatus Polarisedimenticolaceae bacterium]|nr:DUF4440 domain-containing protein [Candidatus Polarisedimenticolaceae bacterium]